MSKTINIIGSSTSMLLVDPLPYNHLLPSLATTPYLVVQGPTVLALVGVLKILALAPCSLSSPK